MTTDPKLVPDMSTPEGIKQAFEHVQEHRELDPDTVQRAMTLEVLRLLEEAGVESVASIEEELKEKDTISEVADAYTEAQASALSGTEHVDLKSVAGIAQAVSSITAAAFAGAEGHGDEGAALLADTQGKLGELGVSEEGEAAREALGGIIQNMFSVLPVEE